MRRQAFRDKFPIDSLFDKVLSRPVSGINSK